jgi:hypothetical protein
VSAASIGPKKNGIHVSTLFYWREVNANNIPNSRYTAPTIRVTGINKLDLVSTGMFISMNRWEAFLSFFLSILSDPPRKGNIFGIVYNLEGGDYVTEGPIPITPQKRK